MRAIQKHLDPIFYVLLSLPSTAMGFALSVQISALSWILSTKYNLKIEEVGLVWAAGPIAGIFGQVIFGVISDQAWFWGGRRRPFILIGGVLAALMLLALPNIEVVSTTLGLDGILGVAILVALMLDLSINVGFNPTRSIIADVTPEGQERTKGYTWMQTISGTFGVLAYVIGAVWGNYNLIYFGAVLVLLLSVIPPFFIEEPRELAQTGDPNKATQRYGLREIMLSILPLWGFLVYAIYGMAMRLMEVERSNYWVEMVCAALTAGTIIYVMSARERGKSRSEAGQIGFRKVLAAHAFTWIGVQTMFIYMFAYVQQQMPELGDRDMGKVVSVAFLVLNAVGALLPAFVLEPLARKIGRVRTHAWSITMMAIGYAGLWLLPGTPTTVYLLMGITGIGWAATISLPFAIMSGQVDQQKMGLYMGLFNLAVVLPQLVASLGIGEWIGGLDQKNLIFMLCSVCLAISAAIWFFVRETRQEA
ncbi:MAG: MFS transporter [Saprospiraceae bacterium]|nr:MFS transporter [Saprospiraceae bacterium]